jgi:hypothetical protein
MWIRGKRKGSHSAEKLGCKGKKLLNAWKSSSNWSLLNLRQIRNLDSWKKHIRETPDFLGRKRSNEMRSGMKKGKDLNETSREANFNMTRPSNS